MSKVLEVKQLSKTFLAEGKGKLPFQAVKNVNFSLQEGEILGLLGPNGAGKSTTISMLLGILTPTSGDILYFGNNLKTHRSEILKSVTFASTYIRLPWRLTVIENLRVYGKMYGLTFAEFDGRSQQFLEYFGVWNQRHKTMNQLSAGQITRVMLAKAFIPYPKVVLLDEPTASLDPDIAHQVRVFVKEQQQRWGTTILYTSHNMDEVSDVCDRVVFLKEGKVVATGTPEILAKSVSTARMHLVMKDGLKRTARIAGEHKLEFLIKEREIIITVDELQIAQFLNELAENKVEYSQISIDKPTLEDYFLSMSLVKKDKIKKGGSNVS